MDSYKLAWQLLERQQACLRQASAAASRLSLRRARAPWSNVAGEDDAEGQEEVGAADAPNMSMMSIIMIAAAAVVMMRGGCAHERLKMTRPWNAFCCCIAAICFFGIGIYLNT
jgi:hypothetical protein